jgi:hypothetical protein
MLTRFTSMKGAFPVNQADWASASAKRLVVIHLFALCGADGIRRRSSITLFDLEGQ